MRRRLRGFAVVLIRLATGLMVRRVKMRVCVYGAGVIGGILASAIARAGHQVALIARGAHLEAIKGNGLTVVTPEGRATTRLAASNDPGDFGPQDFVIVATKTPAFPEVASRIAPLLGENTLVGFAVNGIFWFYGDGFQPGGERLDLGRLDPAGLLHDKIGADRAMGVVCWGGGEIRTPGRVDANGAGGRFVAGTATTANRARAQDLIRSLGVTDVAFESAAEIRRPMWKKFLGIVGNFPACTLTGGTIADTRSNVDVHEIVLSLMAEANAVASAHGFDDLGFDPDEMRRNPGRSPHKPSMLQDFERGRAMELDSTFGALQDLARQAGVATPVLDVVAPLVALKARLAGCA
jgi:2-dehydropantoate 2-reductase